MKDLLEHCSVFAVAGSGIGISYTDIDHGLKLVILLGSAIYVWRRALKRRKRDKPDDQS